MKEEQAERQSLETKGLTLEELEAQGVGGLLPDRIEMKRKRHRGSNAQACGGIAGCVGISVL